MPTAEPMQARINPRRFVKDSRLFINILSLFLFLIIPFNKTVHIPIDYDLATHCCMSPIKSYRTTECSNISEICRYNYGVLGKPDRVAIFKTRIK